MGHANLTKISKEVNKALRKGPCSIKEITDSLFERGFKVCASEGPLTEKCYLGLAVEDVIFFLNDTNQLLEPINLTTKQKKILKQWQTESMWNWDCGDDGQGGEYGIFDSIKWKALKKRLPVLGCVTH